MYYTLYQTINLINNKIYIGAHITTNLNDGYLGSGKIIKNAIKKYGKENFKKQILYLAESIQEMYHVESIIVDKEFCKRNDTYNIKIGGEGGWDHINNSDSPHPRIGKTHSEETKKIMSVKANGHVVSSKTKRKMSFSKMGKNNHFYGKHHTEETKLKMSSSQPNKNGKNNPFYGKKHNFIEKICPHCDLRGKGPNMKRYHFDNCKQKEVK